MSKVLIRPKAGTYFRIGEKVYKAFDEGDETGCNRCVFKGSIFVGCTAPYNLICSDVYIEDHTHQLEGVELVEETTYPTWVGFIIPGLILIGMIIYILIV